MPIDWSGKVNTFNNRETDIVIETQATHGSPLGMLGHLSALTYDFQREGQDVSCVLTYAHPDPDLPGSYRAVVAADTGYEGIACLDDTARAVLLALEIFEETGKTEALDLARRWLTFVAYMQYPDGRFANFIRNAAGIRNASGPTSLKGGHAWTMRALWALARAYRLTGEEEYRDRFEAGRLGPGNDLREDAVLALGELEMVRADPTTELLTSVMDRARRIAFSGGDYFPVQAGSTHVPLWGYHQLLAVAAIARRLDAPDLLGPARRTVRTLIQPDVRARFWRSYPDRQKQGVCVYDVAPIIQGLGELFRATGEAHHRDLALEGAAWLYGRNDVRVAMYDPATGRCRDGITDGEASCNFGAESSIEAGFAEMERRRLLR